MKQVSNNVIESAEDAGLKLSQYLTPMDVAAAVTAGTVAYIRNRADPQTEPEPDLQDFNSVQNEFAQFQADSHATKIAGGWVCTDSNGEPIAVFKTIQGGGLEKFDVVDGQITAGKYFAPDGNTLDLSVDHMHANKAATALAKWTTRNNKLAQDLLNRDGVVGNPESDSVRDMLWGNFSAKNPPKINDMSPEASRFWLENPKIAKANGVTVSNVVRTANGIKGTISRVPPDVVNSVSGGIPSGSGKLSQSAITRLQNIVNNPNTSASLRFNAVSKLRAAGLKVPYGGVFSGDSNVNMDF